MTSSKEAAVLESLGFALVPDEQKHVMAELFELNSLPSEPVWAIFSISRAVTCTVVLDEVGEYWLKEGVVGLSPYFKKYVDHRKETARKSLH